MIESPSNKRSSNQIKFLIGGFLFLVAVIFLIIGATRATAEFFITVRELQESEKDLTGKNLRVSGAVLGDSIFYDSNTGLLYFAIAHIPGDEDDIEALGGLSLALHQAVNDITTPRLTVIYEGLPPDMLRHEAQAILTGTLNDEGIFEAEELLLKCPSKYEDAVPDQVESE
jgi:cytochrome c-type biogenesis protein CcmE